MMARGGLIDPDDPRVAAGMRDALTALRHPRAGRLYHRRGTRWVRVTLLLMGAAALGGALIGAGAALLWVLWWAAP